MESSCQNSAEHKTSGEELVRGTFFHVQKHVNLEVALSGCRTSSAKGCVSKTLHVEADPSIEKGAW
jgi:hypothetical protein